MSKKDTITFLRRKIVDAILQAVRLKHLGCAEDDEGRSVIYSPNDAADYQEYYEGLAMQEGLALIRFTSTTHFTAGDDEEE